jgi:hypothetical protein
LVHQDRGRSASIPGPRFICIAHCQHTHIRAKKTRTSTSTMELHARRHCRQRCRFGRYVAYSRKFKNVLFSHWLQIMFQGGHSARGPCSNQLRTMGESCSDGPNCILLINFSIAAQYLLRACLQRQVSQTPSFCFTDHVNGNAAP